MAGEFFMTDDQVVIVLKNIFTKLLLKYFFPKPDLFQIWLGEHFIFILR